MRPGCLSFALLPWGVEAGGDERAPPAAGGRVGGRSEETGAEELGGEERWVEGLGARGFLGVSGNHSGHRASSGLPTCQVGLGLAEPPPAWSTVAGGWLALPLPPCRYFTVVSTTSLTSLGLGFLICKMQMPTAQLS